MDTRILWTLAVAVIIEIGLPLAVALWLKRRFNVSWRYFVYGAIVFAVAQLLLRLPAISWLQTQLAGTLALNELYTYAFIAFAALTAGLFEEGGRYLGYRFLWNRSLGMGAPPKAEAKTWSRALMYGAGHGGIESILLVGGLTLLSLLQLVALNQLDLSTLPADQAELARQALDAVAETPWWLPLAAGFERAMTLVVQISLSVLVLQVFTRGRFYWWWLAVAYHFIVDLVVVVLRQLFSPALSIGPLTLVLEGVVFLFALLSAWIIYRLRPGAPGVPAEPAEENGAEEQGNQALADGQG